MMGVALVPGLRCCPEKSQARSQTHNVCLEEAVGLSVVTNVINRQQTTRGGGPGSPCVCLTGRVNRGWNSQPGCMMNLGGAAGRVLQPFRGYHQSEWRMGRYTTRPGHVAPSCLVILSPCHRTLTANGMTAVASVQMQIGDYILQ